MALTCDPAALANAAHCFDCVIPGLDQMAVQSYLLAQIAGLGSSEAAIQQLVNDARCFACVIPPGELMAVQTFLLAVIDGVDTLPTDASNDPLAGLDLWGFFSFGTMGGITAITFNTTSSIPGFDIESDPEIVSISFPNLVSVDPTNIQSGYIEISSNPALTTLTMPKFVPNNGNSYGFSGNALTAASVNGILARFVANAAYVSGTINFTGGTNSAPTGQGLVDKATLIGRGAAVNTN